MKKRLIALLLCAAMLLSALPLVSAQGGEITSISVTGVPAPIDGALIPYNSSNLLEAEPLYEAYYWSMSWRVADGYFMPDSAPTFAAGELYTLTLLIVPADGATGLDETTAGTLPVFIAGQKAKYDPDCKPSLDAEPGKETFAYTIDLRCGWTNEIKVIDVYGMILPATGAEPDVSTLFVPEDAPYTIADAAWWRYTTMPDAPGDEIRMEPGEKFVEGTWYYLDIDLVPKEGYFFAASEACYWRINGTASLTDEEWSRSSGTGFDLFSADFQATARHIDVIELNGAAETLYVGDPAKTAFENVTIPAGAGYSLVTNLADVNVSKASTGVYIKDNDLLEAGENYTITLRVTPKDGWTIDSSTVWRINGRMDLVLGAKESTSGYWYCHSVAIPAAARTHIDRVQIFGVTDPVAGWMAIECTTTYVANGPYELVERYWFDDDDDLMLIGDDAFELGKHYMMCNVVKPYEGYVIDDSTVFELNGGDYAVELSGGKPDGSYYVWTEPKEPLETCTVYWYLDVNDEYPIAGVEVIKGDVYGAPAEPGREGYTFGGWFTDKELTKPYDPAAPILEDTNLYPLWVKIVTPSECDGGPSCPSYKFKDVNKGDWYHEAVDFAVKEGLFNGMTDTTFEPNTPMTRAMLVTVLWRYEGSPMVVGSGFIDLTADWYMDPVAWAASKSIVMGVGGGRFDPDGKITREQLAAILYRYSFDKGFDVSKQSDFAGFPDKDKVSSWAKEAFAWAVAEKLITGNEGRLDPQGSATRAQVATILMRFIKNIAK